MLYLFFIASVFITIVSSSLEGDLKRILLDNYDKSSRPVLNVDKCFVHFLYFYNSKLGIRHGGGNCGFDIAINPWGWHGQRNPDFTCLVKFWMERPLPLAVGLYKIWNI